MFLKSLFLVVAVGFAITSPVDAQQYRNRPSPYPDSYYQPRTEYRPAPSREQYEMGGRAVGGFGAAVGAELGSRGGCSGGCAAGAGVVGSEVGGYAAGRVYDRYPPRGETRYYAPPAYGMQTTTPYMIRRDK